jgi:hypothetical protein
MLQKILPKNDQKFPYYNHSHTKKQQKATKLHSKTLTSPLPASATPITNKLTRTLIGFISASKGYSIVSHLTQFIKYQKV